MRALIARPILLCGAWLVTQPASAQIIEIPELELPVSTEFDRGRNEGVMDRPRPAWDPIGIRTGGFIIYPYVEGRIGFTDNVLQSATDKKSDGFVRLNSGISVDSTWSRHSFSAAASSDVYRYFNTPDRNQDGWSVSGKGRVDVSDRFRLNLSAQTARRYESRLSGAAIPDARTSVPFQQTTLRALGDFRLERVRAVAFVNYTALDFGAVTLASGVRDPQSTRDRNILRFGGNVEYGLTPDTGIFVQASYADFDYRRDLDLGVANRDSKEFKIIGGVATDLTNLLRGSVGIGYVNRAFRAPIYKDARGLAVDAKLEYFPTKLTTVSLSGRRQVEDSSSANGAYFETGATLRVDHELLRNLTLSAASDYAVEDYVGADSKGKIFRAGFAARYLASRTMELGADINASERRTTIPGLETSKLTEARATISLRLRL